MLRCPCCHAVLTAQNTSSDTFAPIECDKCWNAMYNFVFGFVELRNLPDMIADYLVLQTGHVR